MKFHQLAFRSKFLLHYGSRHGDQLGSEASIKNVLITDTYEASGLFDEFEHAESSMVWVPMTSQPSITPLPFTVREGR